VYSVPSVSEVCRAEQNWRKYEVVDPNALCSPNLRRSKLPTGAKGLKQKIIAYACPLKEHPEKRYALQINEYIGVC
jgi:hypothetical protein